MRWAWILVLVLGGAWICLVEKRRDLGMRAVVVMVACYGAKRPVRGRARMGVKGQALVQVEAQELQEMGLALTLAR